MGGGRSREEVEIGNEMRKRRKGRKWGMGRWRGVGNGE